jgi:hypothetical protein
MTITRLTLGGMMRKNWVGLAGLVVFGACHSVTDPFANILITVGASPIVASADAPALLTMTVINESGRPFHLDTSPCGSPRFLVRSASGAEIPIATGACNAIKTGVTLTPGAQYAFRMRWDGRDGAGHIVPGEYQVIGAPYGSTGPRSAAAHVTVRNAPPN